MTLRLGIGIIGGLFYVFCVILLGDRLQREQNVENRMNLIETSTQMSSGEPKMAKTFGERLIRPLFQKLVGVVGKLIPLDKKSQNQLSEKLRLAGIKKTAGEYYATQATMVILAGAATFLVVKLIMGKKMSFSVIATFYVMAAYYVVARFRLGKKVTARVDAIENEMPEILDLLSVSVSAGLGFDQALQYVCERCKGELATELSITQREIKLGKPRNVALKALAERCHVDSLGMFVSAIIQADILGIAISNILEIQAENARQQHKQRVEEKAGKLPVKILIPLVFFIFPNIFIILLGPAIPQIAGAFA